MIGIYKLFLFLVVSTTFVFGQNNTNRLVIIGDSLKGKIEYGQNVREVIGNVVITQEDVKITCNRAIQYLASNNVELIGNVIIVQDSVIIKTERGRYFGNIKIAYSDSAVTLNNLEMELFADKGNYNLQTKIANFFGNVVFQDSNTIMNSTKLKYRKIEEELVGVGNVVVTDTASVIKADSLIHRRTTKYSEGFGNVVIESNNNSLTIFGEHLIDDKQEGTSKISGKPFLTQIEELSDGSFDTLFIKSNILESKSDSGSSLYAIDSVQIIRGDFLSNNDYTIYDREEGKISIFKIEDKKIPVLWYSNTQVIGDSIYINLDSSKINFVDIIQNALLISEDSTYEFRYSQMSGDTIQLSFENSKLSQTNVHGNVLSIYYLYEENTPNGLLKSSAKEITINFENSKVTDVKMYGSPISEYHPENLVIENEKNFTLPSFVLFSDKPNKSQFKSIFLKYNLK